MSVCAIGLICAIGGAIAYVNLCHIGLYLDVSFALQVQFKIDSHTFMQKDNSHNKQLLNLNVTFLKQILVFISYLINLSKSHLFHNYTNLAICLTYYFLAFI